MMKSKISILIAVFILTIFGCTKNWDDHYNRQPETVNENVWDAIKERSELSHFVDLMVKYKYDSLFLLSDNVYTLFVPNNSAFDKLLDVQVSDTVILSYHISRHFLQPADKQGISKLQTQNDKFANFEYVNGKSFFDGIALYYESPLYLNGKFFMMEEVALPKLNLFQYFALNMPYLKSYIAKQDSFILDKTKSRPIGFDAEGNTVYDSIAIKSNEIDSLYFPVGKEFRGRTATFVFPRKQNYYNALTLMAQKLGGNFIDYTSIPEKWQEDILIPFLLDHGTFLNMLEESDFETITVLTNKKKYNMVNIQGDSVIANYIPTDKYLCSNGITYDYTNFVIPDSLFYGSSKFQGEWLARPTGVNKFGWKTTTTITSTTTFDVTNSFIKGMSNDSALIVNFTKGYAGVFTLEFKTQNLFPRKYQMIIYTHMDIGGIYDIYVNDDLVKTFDYSEFLQRRGIISSVTGANFVPTGRLNRFDCYVNNFSEYSTAVIRFEYKGPGSAPNNGLVIDMIEFVPVTE